MLATAPALAQTDITQMPLGARNQAPPNIIFAVDDSGSMDFEVLFPTNDGALWWNVGNRNFHDGTAWNFNAGGLANSTWKKYAYLFPNGSGAGARSLLDGDHSHLAVPPTAEFAFARSARFNPLYYDPAVTYAPWPAAYIDGATRSFAAANPTAARSHPWLGSTNHNLTALQSSTAANQTFRFHPGMVIPGGSVAGVQGRRCNSTGDACGNWQNITSAVTVASGETWEVNMPYYPATYWVEDRNCRNGADCAVAPDGTRLRRYEIRPGVSFPSGRTYADELQNFANWFQYYRKRRLALASGMGQALSRTSGLRGGIFNFNDRTNVVMRDFAAESDAANARAIIGAIYTNPANGGTPTREALKHAGEQFRRTDDGAPIQFACQRNAAFVVTDGFANVTNVGVPAYDRRRWVGAAPYTAIYDGSLADLASAYYTLNLRPDLPTGLLSVDPTDTSPGADRNVDLHMQTYGVTLGAVGTIFGTGSPQAVNPFANPPTWPNPNQSHSPTSIDDLWHATLNGRGRMYSALNAAEIEESLRQTVRAMLTAAGSDAGVAVASVNVRQGRNTAYVSSYNARDWSGQLAAYPIDVATGRVDTGAGRELWSARQLLDAKPASRRLIATFDGTRGVEFSATGLASADIDALAAYGATGRQMLDYLRGERALEGSVLRQRASVLGDIVSAEPVLLDDVVYQAANDGMLHAFDANSGEELWAYVPGLVRNALPALGNPTYSHRFFVDGTPTVANLDGRKILVGGLRAGGRGFYALDVTNPRAASERAVADKVLWEFPNRSTPAAVRDQVGLSYGRAVVVRLAYDNRWAVLLTSGYNNASGRGHLHVLDAITGDVLRTLTTPSGSGLAQVSAWVDSAASRVTDFVYGGDNEGNLWRFDLSGAPQTWSVTRMAAFGAQQPITTAPELGKVGGRRVVFVATGRLLGDSDTTTTAVQSVYALRDSATELDAPRAQLQRQTLREAPGGVRNVSSERVDWATSAGWYFDLPAGERVSTELTLAYGMLVFSSNRPSATVCTSSAYLYAVDINTGGQVTGATWTGWQLSYTLAARPVVVGLPSGRVVALTHRADAAVTATDLPGPVANRLRRHGWREVRL
jgi:type IV pilus assembly protein PilY1